MGDLEQEDIEKMVEDILDAGKKRDVRRAVCTRCGQEFETTRPSAKLCQACRNAAKRANASGARKKTEVTDLCPETLPAEYAAEPKENDLSPDPPQVPEAEPEPEPKWLTVQNLLELLTRVPEPERTRVELNDDTIAIGVELRSQWHVGGKTEAVILILDE